jgi:stress responsive alpha/beta barrel protein
LATSLGEGGAISVTAKHIAWFRFKDGVSDDRIDEHMRAVRTLADLVPAVSAIECGKSYTDRAGGLTHCIIVTMPDRESLPRYLEHPAHVPIADALVSDIAELRVIDLDLG